MADINRIFKYLEHLKTGIANLRGCTTLMICPTDMRKSLLQLIEKEIKQAKAGKEARIILKLNSLSDETLIDKLYEAAIAGVELKLIIRSILCAKVENKKFKHPVKAISIVDEYLEHARVMVFHNCGKEKVFISSADWMVRNLDHRIEAAIPVMDEKIREELKDILHIQLEDNVKARWLDNDLSNMYVSAEGKKRVRSQVDIYKYLYKKTTKEEDGTPEVKPVTVLEKV
jgi:polyphosphate kinase